MRRHRRLADEIERLAGTDCQNRAYCGESREVFIFVRPSVLQVNADLTDHAHLPTRLVQIFRTRAYRFVFVVGDPNVAFADVARVIDAALDEVDYLSVLTPTEFKRGGSCIDANLPPRYLRNLIPLSHGDDGACSIDEGARSR